jgi:hypothetical protein
MFCIVRILRLVLALSLHLESICTVLMRSMMQDLTRNLIQPHESSARSMFSGFPWSKSQQSYELASHQNRTSERFVGGTSKCMFIPMSLC